VYLEEGEVVLCSCFGSGMGYLAGRREGFSCVDVDWDEPFSMLKQVLTLQYPIDLIRTV
jgi:hypothetical protein